MANCNPSLGINRLTPEMSRAKLDTYIPDFCHAEQWHFRAAFSGQAMKASIQHNRISFEFACSFKDIPLLANACLSDSPETEGSIVGVILVEFKRNARWITRSVSPLIINGSDVSSIPTIRESDKGITYNTTIDAIQFLQTLETWFNQSAVRTGTLTDFVVRDYIANGTNKCIVNPGSNRAGRNYRISG